MILTRSETFWHRARNYAEAIFCVLMAMIVMAGLIYGLIVIIAAAGMALRDFFR